MSPADPEALTAAAGEKTTAGKKPAGAVRRSVTLVALSLTFGLVQFDATVVNVALNTVRSDLGGGIEAAQWLVDAYAVPFAACMLAAGAIGDRFGHRLMCLLGFVIFGLASLVAALSTGWPMLIFARAVQGVGAAIMLPASLALVRRQYPDPHQRSRALGIWGGIATAGFASGPVVGGLLIRSVGWQSIFWLNLPAAAVIGGVIGFRAPEDVRSRRRPDLIGTMLAIAALAGLTAGIIEGVRLPPPGAALIIIGLGSAVGFVIVERRRSEPLVPPELLRPPAFRWAMITGLIFNFSMYGALLCVSLVVQSAYGFSPVRAGLAVLPMALVVSVGSTSSGFLVAHAGARIPMVIGFGCAVIGLLIMTDGARTARPTVIITGLAVSGLLSLAMPAMTSVALDAAPIAHAGFASGSLNTSRQLGGAVGVAVLGAVLNGAGYRAGFGIAVLLAVLITALGLLSSLRATARHVPAADGS